jgi:hypothetical protein
VATVDPVDVADEPVPLVPEFDEHALALTSNATAAGTATTASLIRIGLLGREHLARDMA